MITLISIESIFLHLLIKYFKIKIILALSTKMLLVPKKCEKELGQNLDVKLTNIAIAILDFFLLLRVKLSLLILFAYFFV